MIINKEEFETSKNTYLDLMTKNMFIYPTDSIYGLGCDATNEVLVDNLRNLKGNGIQPFTIIVPSKQWVYDNCEVGEREKPFVEKLGQHIEINGQKHRFTIILKMKNNTCIAKNVSPGKNTIGVRIPNNWFSKVVEEYGKPLISTSANKTGSDFMTNIDNLNKDIQKRIAFVIYEGEKKGNPSTLINLVKDEKKINIR